MSKITLPSWSKEYFKSSRYKVAYGGRGSGKSWTFARMLILKATQKKIRILCARELQNSIKDSVHKLISDQIEQMDLNGLFSIGESFIRCANGSEFIFKGLRMNAGEIKSMENVVICWVEEAQSVSENSWELLIPTIRAENSEIWITFNPNLKTDATYTRFIENTPPSTVIKKINYSDNPFFPAVLEIERSNLAKVDPDGYAHIWLGECKISSKAQILHGKWAIDTLFVPPNLHPYFGADWGFAVDPTVLIKLYIIERVLYISDEAYAIGCEIDDLPTLFDKLTESRACLIRADSARPETISYLNRHGFRVKSARKAKGSVEDGIEFLRSFEKIIINPKCVNTIKEAGLYSYKTDRITGDILPDIIDANNHCMDAIRYAIEPYIKPKFNNPTLKAYI